MDAVCAHCGAHNFSGELKYDRTFDICCSHQKVPPELFQHDYPQEWRDLLSDPDHPDHKHFHNHIIKYNSYLSLTSIGANLVNQPHGSFIYKVQGLIMHNIYNNALSETVPKFNQCYFYDSAEVLQHRLQRDTSGQLKPRLLETWDNYLRQNNPYVATHLNFVEKEKILKSTGRASQIKNYCIVFNIEHGADLRRYNKPTASEIAAVCHLPLDGTNVRDIVVYPRSSGASGFPSSKVNPASSNLVPMSYVILYPNGGRGWTIELQGLRQHGSRVNVSHREFYSGKFAVRPDVFNPLLYGKKLTQQFIVDIVLQQIELRMLYLRQNQSMLRVESYLGLQDYLANQATDVGGTVGKKVICPSTVTGSDRWYREIYLDAIAIMQEFGRPDLFITITCSPDWPEITENLFRGQTWSDRPDLVSRVFNLRLKGILQDIVVDGVFGKVKAWNYTVEFQKRGLPHVHLLVINEEGYKITTVDQVDEIITAELPNKETEPELYKLITKAQIHGPCNVDPQTRTCRQSGQNCRYHYPHDFRDDTVLPPNGFPLYKRRPGPSQQIYTRGKQVTIDNRWVVPYNKQLSMKHQCHINVEACTSVRALKYIYKYQNKGGDRGNLIVKEDGVLVYDEIKAHVDGMVLTAAEAAWHLRAFKRHDRSHTVTRLPVHLPDQQNVTFTDKNLAKAVEKASKNDTQLTAFFKLCNSDNPGSATARTLLYQEMPEHFTFNKKTGVWKPRGASRWKIIGRLYNVSPKDPERYYARLLLMKRRGPKSYEDLRTVDGVLHPTYRSAAVALGIVHDSNEWHACIAEAATYALPARLRSLFATIIAFNQPGNPVQLWNTFKVHFIEDYTQHHSEDNAEILALQDVQRHMQFLRMDLNTFGFTVSTAEILLPEPSDVPTYDEVTELVTSLNVEQKAAFDVIKTTLDSPSQSLPNCFFLEGPGGCGKTYTYTALQKYAAFSGKHVLTMATTGIAADLLVNGRTMHSGFSMPLDLDGPTTVTLKRSSRVHKELKEADLIIIDEASAIRSAQLTYISEVLQYVMQNKKPFGSKVIVLGGDFRQTLPVIRGAAPGTVLQSVIKASGLWSNFKVLRLQTNVRAQGHLEFCNWLLDVGDGKLQTPHPDYPGYITIPKDYVAPTADIIQDVYEDVIQLGAKQQLAERCVVTPKNDDANRLNKQALDRLNTPVVTYVSSDEVDEEDVNHYPPEFLNSQNPAGMPLHQLQLKVGAVIMSLRNLQPDSGVQNGTRLIVVELRPHVIIAEILKGSKAGQRVFIPRITCVSADTSLPFVLRRTQFPVALSFAMTINKSQGQSFDRVGVYLPGPVFSHGQLYVALSRTRNPEQLYVCVTHKTPPGTDTSTINVVWNQVLN